MYIIINIIISDNINIYIGVVVIIISFIHNNIFKINAT